MGSLHGKVLVWEGILIQIKYSGARDEGMKG
jgi:hypothetical protein